MYLLRNPKRKNTPKEPNIKKQKRIPLQAFLPLLLSPTPSNFLWTSRTSSPILSVLLPSLFPLPSFAPVPPFLPFFLPHVLIQLCFFFLSANFNSVFTLPRATSFPFSLPCANSLTYQSSPLLACHVAGKNSPLLACHVASIFILFLIP